MARASSADGLQTLLPLAVLLDAVAQASAISMSLMSQITWFPRGRTEAVPPAANVGKLRLGRLEPLALLAGHAVHLLVEHAHEVADVGLGEDVRADLVDDERLEAARVEPGSEAAA